MPPPAFNAALMVWSSFLQSPLPMLINHNPVLCFVMWLFGQACLPDPSNPHISLFSAATVGSEWRCVSPLLSLLVAADTLLLSSQIDSDPSASSPCTCIHPLCFQLQLAKHIVLKSVYLVRHLQSCQRLQTNQAVRRRESV